MKSMFIALLGVAKHQQEAGLDPRLRWGYKLPENPVHAKSLRTAIELYNKEIGTERFKLVA